MVILVHRKYMLLNATYFIGALDREAVEAFVQLYITL